MALSLVDHFAVNSDEEVSTCHIQTLPTKVLACRGKHSLVLTHCGTQLHRCWSLDAYPPKLFYPHIPKICHKIVHNLRLPDARNKHNWLQTKNWTPNSTGDKKKHIEPPWPIKTPQFREPISHLSLNLTHSSECSRAQPRQPVQSERFVRTLKTDTDYGHLQKHVWRPLRPPVLTLSIESPRPCTCTNKNACSTITIPRPHC